MKSFLLFLTNVRVKNYFEASLVRRRGVYLDVRFAKFVDLQY